MSSRRALSITFILVFGYLIQTVVISDIPFPLAGPDLLLLVLFAWVLQLPVFEGVVVAFLTGLLLDLAPPIDGPVGKWALVLTLIALALAPLANDSQAHSPMTALGILALASAGTVAVGYVISSVLGESGLQASTLLTTIIGVGMWNTVFAPLAMMVVRKIVRSTITVEVLR